MKLECPVCGEPFAVFESLSTHLRWNHIEDRLDALDSAREKGGASMSDCEKSPHGHHEFVYATAEHVSVMTCRFCREPAPSGAIAADPADRWARHD